MESLEIPEFLESVETYVYLGFNEATAQWLWSCLLLHSSPGGLEPPDLGEQVLLYIDHFTIEEAEVDDDWALMDRVGINTALKSAIMSPEFEDVRDTASCTFWLMEAVHGRWSYLKGLDLRYRMVQDETSQRPSDDDSSEPTISSDPNPLTPKKRKKKFCSPETGTLANPTAQAESASPLQEDEGHVMLWRGGDNNKHTAFYNKDTGEIDLSRIFSMQGDFSGLTSIPYFTSDREAAEKYAEFALHYLPDNQVSILQVAVPKSFIERLDVQYLWYGSAPGGKPSDTWQQLIWWSRRGRDTPESLDWITEKDLLIGHIARSIHQKYQRMRSHHQIKESALLSIQVDGVEQKAIQWVFQSKIAQRGFQNVCKGRVWLHPL